MTDKTKPEDFSEAEMEYLIETSQIPEKFLAMSEFERRSFVLDLITAFPDRHEQEHWFIYVEDEVTVTNPSCGTACCVAGWAAVLSGAKPAIAINGAYNVVELPDGRDYSVSGYARELLGLTEKQSDVLFAGNNTLSYIRKAITALNETGTIPDMCSCGVDSCMGY